MMTSVWSVAVTWLVLVTSEWSVVQAQDRPAPACKSPPVVTRLLADDARAASPFYVVAMPRTPLSSRIDNICYSYFDRQQMPFLHLMSVINSDGSNQVHTFTKGDIAGRKGLALATSEDGSCSYHDYTLKPICNSTVFILYRCFIQGECASGTVVDAGRLAGVDVRVALAATPGVSPACQRELRDALRDTSDLAGADYVILPQRRRPNCVTSYNATTSLNAQPSPADRFGEGASDKPATQTQNGNSNSGNTPAPGSYGGGHAYQPYPSNTQQQGYTPVTGHPQGQAQGGWGSWGWNPPQAPHTQTTQQGNVVYHVHRWDTPPPGCCPCNGWPN